jgi:hypothetical protein
MSAGLCAKAPTALGASSGGKAAAENCIPSPAARRPAADRADGKLPPVDAARHEQLSSPWAFDPLHVRWADRRRWPSTRGVGTPRRLLRLARASMVRWAGRACRLDHRPAQRPRKIGQGAARSRRVSPFCTTRSGVGADPSQFRAAEPEQAIEVGLQVARHRRCRRPFAAAELRLLRSAIQVQAFVARRIAGRGDGMSGPGARWPSSAAWRRRS